MLTNATVRSARVRARAYKLWDEGGLHLHVAPTGTKAWRFRFRAGASETVVSLGHWPEIDVATARERRDRARDQLRGGTRPTRSSAQSAAAPVTLEAVARAWHAGQLSRWSAVHGRDVLASLERDVFPALGAAAIPSIDTPAIRELLRAVETRGALESARRLQQRLAAIFAFAISEGLATQDPATIVARAMPPAPDSRRQPALTDLKEVRAAFRSIAGAAAPLQLRLAGTLLALTAVRSACIRRARWEEFEGIDWITGTGTAAQWRIPAAHMKLKRSRKADASFDHVVPLAPSAVAVLFEARSLAGGAALVFPGRGRGLGENALLELHASAGLAGRHTPHGWRASFSTILNERRPEDRAAIDLALAHAPKEKVEAAYNRAEYLERRRELLQAWADLLGAPDAPRRG